MSKEPIQLFNPKSSLVDWTKIKIVAKEKIKSPSTTERKLETT